MPNGRYINLDTVKAKAQGRWAEIYLALAPKLSEAVNKIGHHVPCPVHGGSDGFRLFAPTGIGGADGLGICNSCETFNGKPLDGLGILSWVNGWGFREALEAVDDYLAIGRTAHPCSPPPLSQPQPKAANPVRSITAKVVYAQMANAAAIPSYAHLAYFKNRGLEIAKESLELEGLLYGNHVRYAGGAGTPAILGKITDASGRLLGLHQIYLTEDGKKFTALPDGTPFEPKRYVKKVEKLSGGAIRFGEARKVLAVGEGLETMLAVAAAFNTPSVAATGTATLLSKMQVPENVEKLVIFADKDASGAGERAAEALYHKERYKRDVEILVPPLEIPDGKKNVDWLDVYCVDKSLIKTYYDSTRHKKRA